MATYTALPANEKKARNSPQKKVQDPFYALKKKMQMEVASLQSAFETWKDLLANTNTTTNKVCKSLFHPFFTFVKHTHILSLSQDSCICPI